MQNCQIVKVTTIKIEYPIVQRALLQARKKLVKFKFRMQHIKFDGKVRIQIRIVGSLEKQIFAATLIKKVLPRSTDNFGQSYG